MALTEINLSTMPSGTQKPSGDSEYLVTGTRSNHGGVTFTLGEGETIRVVIKDATFKGGQWCSSITFSGPNTATAYVAFEGTSSLSGHNHGGLKTTGPKLFLESNSGGWATAKLEARYSGTPALQCEKGGTVELAPGVKSQGDTIAALKGKLSGEIRLLGPRFKVTLDGADDGASVLATYGEKLPDVTPPTKEGYEFLGYFDATEGGTKYYDKDGVCQANWPVAGEGTLYAQWKVVPAKSVTKEWIRLNPSADGQVLGTSDTITYYYVYEDVTCGATTAGTSGLSIAPDADVYIYVPEDVTLTATGADGEGTTGGGAGIHVPATSKLYLIGSGMVNATGGKGGNGGNGSNGTDSSAYNSSESSTGGSLIWNGYMKSGNGGAGGAGGGGAGAGIGTPGATGLNGGAGGTAIQTGTLVNYGDASRLNDMCYSPGYSKNGNQGSAGGNSVTASAMGNLYQASTLSVNATAGAAGRGGAKGSAGSKRWIVALVYGYEFDYTLGSCGGGGGGGGGYAGAAIGAGGASGAGGGGGGTGGYMNWGGSEWNNINSGTPGIYADGGGGVGGVGGNGGAAGDGTATSAINGVHYSSTGGASGASGTAGAAGAAKAAGTAAAPEFAVTYLDKDGVACGNATYAVGSATTISLMELTGYGWQLAAYGNVCGNPSDLTGPSSESFSGTINARNVYGDISFRAVACPYDVALDLAGGSGADRATVTCGYVPAKLTPPTKAGAKFGGFFTEPNGEGEQVFDASGIAAGPWSVGVDRLYALWTSELWVGGSVGLAYDIRAVKPGKMDKSEVLTSSPTVWTDGKGTAQILAAIGEGDPVVVVDDVRASSEVWTPSEPGLYTLSHTLGGAEVETAQFRVEGFDYRVEFDANGGEGEMEGAVLTYGSEGTAPACAFTRDGYLFDAWNTRADGSGESVAEGGSYRNLVATEGATGCLYAQWKVDPAKSRVYTVEVTLDSDPTQPKKEPVTVPIPWVEKNVPGIDPEKPEDVATVLDTPDPKTGLKPWQKYVLGIDKGETSAQVWTSSVQQKDKDKIRVSAKKYNLTKDTGITVKYRLDTQLKGKAKTKSAVSASPDFDIDLSGDDPTGLYTVNVVFIPDGGDGSYETVESMNTMGILKVPSPKTLEIVAVPWEQLAPSGGVQVLVADLVKTATLTPGDKLHVYDRATKDYKSWSYDAEDGWVSLGTFKVTAAGLSFQEAGDQTEQAVARGSAVWLERQNASKPFYLYGQYAKDEVATKVEKNKHNLVACPKMEAFRLNSGKITGDIGPNDQIMVPGADGNPPKLYSYKAGKGWGYNTIPEGGKRLTFVTTDDEVPAGTGFWYISKGGDPTIAW